MQFKKVSTSEAERTILAHSLKLQGKRFGKGRILSAQDIRILADAGIDEVTVAILEADDIGEDAAAAEIASRLAGGGTRAGPAFTGRTNLYSTQDGLVAIDRQAIDEANLIDDALTIATLNPLTMVSRDEIVATVKVIPYAAAKNAVDAVAKISGNSPIEVHAFRQMSTALIVTQLEEPKASIVEKTRNILAARLKPIGGTISSETYCPHTADSVAEKLREAQRSGAEIYFVLGASAISDRRDVIPSGLVRAGGEIIHFGMPVDPGNLLLLGKLGGRYVIGLPGCARSPKVNGLDLILRQIFAGIDVSREDIMRMGVGGLLTEMTERPQPRHGKVERAADKKTQNAAPKIAAVVLAAGLSSRMGSNKLLAEINGSTLIRKTVSAALESNVSSVVVVTGHQEAMIHKALAGLDVAYAHNPQYADGLSSSLRTGITALPDDCDGAIVMLGDMPEISVGLLNKLIGAFSPDTGCAIGIATSAGKRGNPVLWARRFFAEIEQITGDTGAKHLVGKHEDLVFEIEAGDSAFLDVDTPEALDALKARTNVGTVGS